MQIPSFIVQIFFLENLLLLCAAIPENFGFPGFTYFRVFAVDYSIFHNAYDRIR